jgi:hypothetical protein
MTGRLSKNFHGVGIGPLSKILAVKGVFFRFSRAKKYFFLKKDCGVCTKKLHQMKVKKGKKNV